MKVAKVVLPEADADVLKALAIHARSSARYLAAIDAIAKRARFIAMRAGRKEASTGDVRKAMQESVIPADSKLLRALEAGRKSKLAPVAPQAILGSPQANDLTEAPQAAAMPAARRRSGNLDAEGLLPDLRRRGHIEADLIAV